MNASLSCKNIVEGGSSHTGTSCIWWAAIYELTFQVHPSTDLYTLWCVEIKKFYDLS
jgi:hypothetical protein